MKPGTMNSMAKGKTTTHGHIKIHFFRPFLVPLLATISIMAIGMARNKFTGKLYPSFCLRRYSTAKALPVSHISYYSMGCLINSTSTKLQSKIKRQISAIK